MAITSISVSSKATFHLPSESKTGGKSKTTKQATKTKKFDYEFRLTSEEDCEPEASAYLRFLRKLLEVHNQSFVVTKKARFGFKYTHKGQRCAFLLSFKLLCLIILVRIALNVENKEEYDALVEDIEEKKVQQIQVTWDMKNVKQKCAVQVRY